MRGSLRIAKIFGIPVHVHWSFALLFLFVIYYGKSNDASWANIAVFGLFILALFTCVLLHEFGHALSARYFGVNTKDITILPIGGVARLDKLPEKPFQEFIVALAGPAVNAVIYIVLAVVLYYGYELSFSFKELLPNNSNKVIVDPVIGFLATLLQANFTLVLFNMIPAFPMDGGRVLRALLSIPFGRVQATKIAAFLGQVIAVGFLIYALLPAFVYVLTLGESYFYPENTVLGQKTKDIDWDFQPILALIAGFVFYAARTEYQQIKLEGQLTQFTVSQIMRTAFTPFQTSDPIHSAIQELTKGKETNFLVFDDANILRGVLQEADIMDAMKHRHYDAMISTYTTSNFEKTTVNATLKDVYDKMYNTGQYILPVFGDNKKTESNQTENADYAVLGVVDLAALEEILVGTGS
jgi:Zn-dependent protease